MYGNSGGAPASDIPPQMRENAKKMLREELCRSYPPSVLSLIDTIETHIYDKSSNAAEYNQRLRAKLQQALAAHAKKQQQHRQQQQQQQQQPGMAAGAMMPGPAGGYDMGMPGVYSNAQATQQQPQHLQPQHMPQAPQFNQYSQAYGQQQQQQQQQQQPFGGQQQQQQPLQQQGGGGDADNVGGDGDDFADFCSQLLQQPTQAAAQHAPVRQPQQPGFMPGQGPGQPHTVNPFQVPGGPGGPSVPNPTGMNPFAMQSNPAIPSQVPVQNPGANNMWQGVAPIHGSLLQQQHAMQAAKAQQQQQQQQVPQPQQQQQPMVQRGMGMPPGPVAAVPAPGAAAQHAGAPGGSAPPPNEKYNPEQLKEMYWNLQTQLRTKYLDRIRPIVAKQQAAMTAAMAADPASVVRMQQRLQQLLGLVKTLEAQRTDPGAENIETTVQSVLMLQKYQKGIAKLLEDPNRAAAAAAAAAAATGAAGKAGAATVRQPSPSPGGLVPEAGAPAGPGPAAVLGQAGAAPAAKLGDAPTTADVKVEDVKAGDPLAAELKVKADAAAAGQGQGQMDVLSQLEAGLAGLGTQREALSRVLALLGTGAGSGSGPGAAARMQGRLHQWLAAQTAVPAVPTELLPLYSAGQPEVQGHTAARCVTVCGEQGPTQVSFAAASPDSCESEAIAAPEQQWGAGSSLQLWLEGEDGRGLGAEGSAAELGTAGTGLKRRRQELDQVVAEADARLAGSGIRLVRMEPSSSFEAALCHRGSVLVQCSAVAGAAPSPALPQGVPAAGGAIQHMEEPWQRLMIQLPPDYPDSPATALFPCTSPAYASPQGVSVRQAFQTEVENSDSACLLEELAQLWREAVRFVTSVAPHSTAAAAGKPPLAPR